MDRSDTTRTSSIGRAARVSLSVVWAIAAMIAFGPALLIFDLLVLGLAGGTAIMHVRLQRNSAQRGHAP
jgi:hypothetical protein